MRAWLKLIGTSERNAPEAWVIERKDLLRESRFSERNPPDPISRGDRLVYHAVGWQRLIAIVEVLDDEPTRDPAPSEWEKQWPLILRVRPRRCAESLPGRRPTCSASSTTSPTRASSRSRRSS